MYEVKEQKLNVAIDIVNRLYYCHDFSFELLNRRTQYMKQNYKIRWKLKKTANDFCYVDEFNFENSDDFLQKESENALKNFIVENRIEIEKKTMITQANTIVFFESAFIQHFQTRIKKDSSNLVRELAEKWIFVLSQLINDEYLVKKLHFYWITNRK